MEDLNLDLEDIKIFQEVAWQQSITKAAENLGYAQSSVTSRIRKLEAEFKITLLYRSSKGVKITPAGKIFLDKGLQINRLIEELHYALSSDKSPMGLLRIGSMETTAAIHLTPLLKNYIDLYKDVDLSFQTGTTKYLVQQVLNCNLDLAFVASPINLHEIVEIPVFEEELVIISKRVPYPQSISEIIKKRTILVFRHGCSYRTLLEKYLSEMKVGPLNRLEFGSLDTIITSVESGLGISLLPKSTVRNKLETGSLTAYRLPNHLKNNTTLLIHRKDIFKTPAIQKFIDSL